MRLEKRLFPAIRNLSLELKSVGAAAGTYHPQVDS